MKNNLFAGASVGLCILASATTVSAQSIDYGAMQQLFNEPVTTSATGSPQRSTEAPVRYRMNFRFPLTLVFRQEIIAVKRRLFALFNGNGLLCFQKSRADYVRFKMLFLPCFVFFGCMIVFGQLIEMIRKPLRFDEHFAVFQLYFITDSVIPLTAIGMQPYAITLSENEQRQQDQTYYPPA